MRHLKSFFIPPLVLSLMIVAIYWQFFLLGKIPVPADTLVGAYYPWLDYKWGFEVGVPVKNALISDVFSQFFLWKYLIVDLIRSGQLPLWNVYSFSGTPLLATYHSAVLNPFNILLFLPKYYGWGFYIFGQTLAASLGMYFLLGRFIKSYEARTLGGLVFSMSGLMTTWAEFGTGVWAAAMLPWTIYFLDKFLKEGRLRNLFLMSFAQVILYFSGHAQLTLYSSVLISVYGLFFGGVKKSIVVALFLGFSIGIASVQFLPTFDLTKNSVREGEAYSKSFNFGLNPWYEVVRLFSADFFGNPTTYNHWDDQSYHEQSSFLGSLTLIFIAPLLFKRFRDKVINFFGVTFLISLFLAFQNPLTEWFYSLPLPLITYSSASRIFFITSFSVAVLLGVGVRKFIIDEEYFKLVKKSSVYGFSLVVGILVGMLVVKKLIEPKLSSDYIRIYSNNLSVSVKNLILPLGFVSILVGLSHVKITRWVLVFVVVVIFFFDLGRYFLKYNPFVGQNLIFPNTPAVDFLQTYGSQFRIARIDKEVMPPNTWVFYGVQSIEGYDPLALESYGRLFNLINGEDFENGMNRYMEVRKIVPEYLDAMNVKYLLTVKRNEKGETGGNLLSKRALDTGYKKVFEDKNTVVLENPNAPGRAYFVNDVINVKNIEELKRVMMDSQFNPTKQAVIFLDNKMSVSTSSGQVNISKYLANEVEFQTKSETEAFLVFADSFDKGWKLLINGEGAQIYQANEGLRGIFVPPGENSYKMFYFPDSLDLGIKVSLISIAGLIAVALYSLKKRTF